jgi:hypothetical protein
MSAAAAKDAGAETHLVQIAILWLNEVRDSFLAIWLRA